MDFNKLFKNTHAVSPVIGVILMVAITVILAAAIGSSVFGQGPAKSAPQANFDIKSAGVDTNGMASIRIEHLGGDPIHFDKDTVTKVTASLNGAESVQILSYDITATTPVEGLPLVMSVGDMKILKLASLSDGTKSAFGTTNVPKAGDTVSIKIIDVQTNQLICDKDIRL